MTARTTSRTTSHAPSRFVLSRRTFLRGSAGAMLALPVLEAMLDGHGTALAQGRPLPRRFGVFFWGNGVRLDRWNPTTTGAGYALSPALQPLSPVKNYVSVVSGYEVKAAGPRGHHDGESGMLSGVEFIPLDHPNSNYSSKFGAPSIDQLLASELHPDKPVLCVGVSTSVVSVEGPTLNFISHRGPDASVPAIRNPAAVYRLLFGGFSGGTTTDPRNALRTSILDLVRDDVTRLQARLGANDRQRLDAHLTGISELRTRITALPPELTGACHLPAPAPEIDVDGPAHEVIDGLRLREVSDIMADLVVMAFACDITRATSFMFTGSVGGAVFPGQTAGHHDLTHDGSDDAQNRVHQTTVQTMEAFSSLVQKLAATPEGAGNLLDQSLFLATSDTAEGLTHSVKDYPILLVGRAGGAMKHPGVHVRGPQLLTRNTNDVLVTILRAMGSSRTSIGTGLTTSIAVVPDVLA